MVRICRLLFGLLTLGALARQLAVHVSLGLSVTNFFSYYTILSNLFAGAVLLLTAATSSPSSRTVETLRVISTINMALVGIVFSLLLRNTDLGPLLPWVNTVHHYLMPCVVLVDWIAVPPRTRLGARDLAIALVFPLLYLVYSLVRGQSTGWYPYPFLNASVAGGAGAVSLYVLGITLVVGIVGAAVIAIGNRRRSTGTGAVSSAGGHE